MKTAREIDHGFIAPKKARSFLLAGRKMASLYVLGEWRAEIPMSALPPVADWPATPKAHERFAEAISE